MQPSKDLSCDCHTIDNWGKKCSYIYTQSLQRSFCSNQFCKTVSRKPLNILFLLLFCIAFYCSDWNTHFPDNCLYLFYMCICAYFSLWSVCSNLLLIFLIIFFQLDDKSFVKYIFCEYFCPAYGSNIHFLNGVFWLPEVLVSMKFYLYSLFLWL